MSKLHLLRCSLTRRNLQNIGRITQIAEVSSNSSSDDERKPKPDLEQKKKSEEALSKLNTLLKTMIEDDVGASKRTLDLAKPSSKRIKDVKKEAGVQSIKTQSTDAQIVSAVKDVAKSLGGDIKQTESELLMKLLNPTNGGKSSTSLGDLVKGMKIDKESPNEQTKAHQVRKALQANDFKRDPRFKTRSQRSNLGETKVEKIDLFGGEPLGIFTTLPKDATGGVENETWNHLHRRDLRLAVTHPPKNYFEQMILWTEQGKVWRFPIDNEQDLEEEKKVYFDEHVFLDKHLEPWCPQKGPLRHFMELVCVGLSKNPYLTVEAKKEHINWFRNYFEEKKQLLKEVGALQDQGVGKKHKSQQIES